MFTVLSENIANYLHLHPVPTEAPGILDRWINPICGGGWWPSDINKIIKLKICNKPPPKWEYSGHQSHFLAVFWVTLRNREVAKGQCQLNLNSHVESSDRENTKHLRSPFNFPMENLCSASTRALKEHEEVPLRTIPLDMAVNLPRAGFIPSHSFILP